MGLRSVYLSDEAEFCLKNIKLRKPKFNLSGSVSQFIINLNKIDRPKDIQNFDLQENINKKKQELDIINEEIIKLEEEQKNIIEDLKNGQDDTNNKIKLFSDYLIELEEKCFFCNKNNFENKYRGFLKIPFESSNVAVCLDCCKFYKYNILNDRDPNSAIMIFKINEEINKNRDEII